MNKVETLTPFLEPVHVSGTVSCGQKQAFDLFTAGIADWWPLDRYSVSQERTRNVILEPRAGGAVYEERDDGETFPWGKVITWEPPDRLVLQWHPGRDPGVAQEVQVSFVAVAKGTRVELEHRNWQQLGEDAASVRENYANGWLEVFGRCFVNACANSGRTADRSG